MIKRITIDVKEGDVVELNKNSSPLFIFHDGKLVEINPFEFNICGVNSPEDRWNEITKHRFMTNQYKSVTIDKVTKILTEEFNKEHASTFCGCEEGDMCERYPDATKDFIKSVISKL